MLNTVLMHISARLQCASVIHTTSVVLERVENIVATFHLVVVDGTVVQCFPGLTQSPFVIVRLTNNFETLKATDYRSTAGGRPRDSMSASIVIFYALT